MVEKTTLDARKSHRGLLDITACTIPNFCKALSRLATENEWCGVKVGSEEHRHAERNLEEQFLSAVTTAEDTPS